MQRIERLGTALAISLGAMGMATFGQGTPPPPPAIGQPFSNLTKSELACWKAGQRAFLQPATVAGGLGPVFNESSCAKCHGGTQAAPGSSGTELVTRFGRFFDNQFDTMIELGGPSLQAKGIGLVNGVNYVGEVVPPQATVVAHRRTLPLFGLGLVEAVPDSAFIALSAHQHQLNPATAGVVSLVVDPATGHERVGRFGWKAHQATLLSFAAEALLNEMGVTNLIFPVENCPEGNCSILAANPANTEPNLPTGPTLQQLADFVTFNAPPPPGPTGPTTQAGQVIFGMIGCNQCHQPTLQTGTGRSAVLTGVNFAPYSDFLLHDMGSLGDGIVQGSAGPTQMRTAPLWGLRLETTFLHDGRASTIDQAILAHQGQGATASHNYATLNATQKAQLVAFLNSL